MELSPIPDSNQSRAKALLQTFPQNHLSPDPIIIFPDTFHWEVPPHFPCMWSPSLQPEINPACSIMGVFLVAL